MTTNDDPTALFLQTIAELHRGLDIAAAEAKAGRLGSLRDTVTALRYIVELQDKLAAAVITDRSSVSAAAHASVPCPSCGAPAGEHCRTKAAHAERLEAVARQPLPGQAVLELDVPA